MQEEPKPTPKPKKKRISKRVVLIVLGLILVVAAIGAISYFAFIKDNRPVVDCKVTIEKSFDYLSEQKYIEGLNLLNKYRPPCKENNYNNFNISGQPLSNEKKLIYADLLVQFYYKSGDKDSAKNLSKEIINNASTVQNNLTNVNTDDFNRIDESLKRAYMLKVDKYYEVPKGLGSEQ